MASRYRCLVSTGLVASALTTAYQGRDLNVYVGVLDTAGAVVADPIKIFAGKMDVMTVEDNGARPPKSQ